VVVVTADVRDVYTDYTRPICRVDVVDVYRTTDGVDVANVQAHVLAVYRPIDAAERM